jgi:polyhydroxyalkanoate synthase
MKGLPALLSLWKRPKPNVGATPADVVFQENKWKLLRYTPRAQGLAHKTPLLLVPSLINRHYVLDLMPGKSFAEWFVAQGHDVWCIDWGTPGDEDRFVSFDDVVDKTIGRALNQVTKRAGVTKAHVLGYCMGGTLAAVHAALHPERFQSFIALAAPVRFDDGGLLSQWTRLPSFDVDTMVDACGTVPWQLMQSAFHMLRPTLSLSKAVMLLDRAWNDEFLDGFLALEAWGNDNVSLPGDFYRTYVKSLYRENALVNGTLHVSGKPARLSNIDCPTLCVSFEQDNIVPRASSAALVEHIASVDKQDLHLAGGHVGAVVSKHAAKTLWPQLSQWLATHEPAATPVGGRRPKGERASATT